MRPAGVVSEIRGQLHVRLFNVGSRSSLDRAGVSNGTITVDQD